MLGRENGVAFDFLSPRTLGLAFVVHFFLHSELWCLHPLEKTLFQLRNHRLHNREIIHHSVTSQWSRTGREIAFSEAPQNCSLGSRDARKPLEALATLYAVVSDLSISRSLHSAH